MIINRGAYYPGTPVAESVGAQWQLAGTVEFVRKWNPQWFARIPSPVCLRLVRKLDALSLPIRYARNFGRLLPKVTITTPSGIVTLVNARVVGGGSVPSHSGSGSSKHSKESDTWEIERIEFTFQKIEVSHKKGGVSASDDWDAPS